MCFFGDGLCFVYPLPYSYVVSCELAEMESRVSNCLPGLQTRRIDNKFAFRDGQLSLARLLAIDDSLSCSKGAEIGTRIDESTCMTDWTEAIRTAEVGTVQFGNRTVGIPSMTTYS